MKKPVVLLIWCCAQESGVWNGSWRKCGTYATDADAQHEFLFNISGRGFTAMAWWGPEKTAKKMRASGEFLSFLPEAVPS